MKKKYTSIFLLLFSFSFLNAQITVFASGMDSYSIYLEDDDLYYTDGEVFYKFNISDIDFPTTSFVYDVSDDSDFIPHTFTKNGADIYYGTLDGPGFGYIGVIYKLDTATSTVTQLTEWPPHTSANNLEYKSGYLYYGCLSPSEVAENLRRINLGSIPPITPTDYVPQTTTSLTIDGFAMYLGTDDGEIYAKNMLTGATETLVYAGGEGIIRDLQLFESWLYFTDNDGIKRINPLDAVPVSQLIASNTDYGIFTSIATKAYGDGGRILFAMDVVNDRILKIDLNDPTLSIKATIANKSVVFPNPVLNIVTIKTSSNIEKLSLYDLLGKRVFNISLSNPVLEYNIDVSSLSSGVYNLQIKTDKGSEFKKLIKE